ncbi:MAG TPA: DNA repair protein RecO [Clostridiaceae bacterium]|nr:DNA repair protein RecO [Clostridiaceae bacterium]
MSFLKTKGIIIKEVNIGEADKIVTIFTKSNGKISASARGARRPRSKLVAGTQFLCYSDFVLFKGREMYSINSCEVIEPFYEIRNDIVRLTYSAHIVDIINDIVQENQPASRTLQLFLNTLHMLTKTNRNPELVTRIFELRLLSILGYAPFVKGCISCGKTDTANLMFSFKKCGFICDEAGCREKDNSAVRILPGTAKAMYHIVHSRMEELFSFDVSQEVLGELGTIMRRYLRERLERDYTKLDFLKSLNNA